MRVVVAPDKFKGSLTAAEVAARVAAGIAAVRPGVTVVQVPVADGGDGTVDAALAAGYERVPVQAQGPLGDPLETAFAERDGVAVIEMAGVSGLALLLPDRLAACDASSFGTGQVVRAALDRGVTTVTLGIGGSASTDGGAGLLQALGARLLDDRGAELARGGAALGALDRIDLSALHPRIRETRFVVASDVDNPLLGPHGAAAVYGPQKGATDADVALLDSALTRWADVVDATVGAGPALRDTPGAGAAGGVGYAAIALLGAELRPGIELLLDLVRFADHLPGADLVVTGEGSLDEQTLNGKAPAGVAAAAAAAGVPVVTVSGRVALSREQLHATGVRQAYALTDIEPDIRRCIAEAGPLLQELARQLARDWLDTRDETTHSTEDEPMTITVPLFVNGEGMSGGKVHHSIEGLPFLGAARTAPKYRFYAVRDEFPALWPVDEGGVGVEGELYEVPLDVIRDRFIPAEPPELELGVVELEDGGSALVVLLREVAHEARKGLKDISEHGGWRVYRAGLGG